MKWLLSNNFSSYNMLDKTLKDNISKSSKGIYIISYLDSPDGNRVKRVKIGMAASNILRRLDAYHTCFSDSFFTWSCILMKDILTKPDITKIEKEIHNALKVHLYKHNVYNARKEGEWFELTKNILKSKIEKVLSNNSELIKEVVNFHNGFRLELKGKTRNI